MKIFYLCLMMFIAASVEAKEFIELNPVLYSMKPNGINEMISSQEFKQVVQTTKDGIYLVSWMDPNLWECRSSLTQIDSRGKIRTEYPEFIGGSNGTYVFYLGEKSDFEMNNANILSFANSCLSQVYQQGNSKYDSVADGTEMALADSSGILSTSGFYIKKMQLGKKIVSYGIVLKNKI